MDRNFKVQVQDSFLEYVFGEIGRFEKRIALSGKKQPLVNPTVPISSTGPEVPMYGRKRAPRPAEEVKIKLPDNIVRLRAVGSGGRRGKCPP